MRAVLRHPLAIISLFATVVFGGLVTLPSMPIDLLPNLKLPRLVVVSSLAKAPAQEVELLLTRVVEEAVGTVIGVRSMYSVSSEGTSMVVLKFDWGMDMKLAAAEVREKLDLVADQFPREAVLPTVIQYDPTDAPILTLAATGTEGLGALRSLAEDSIKTELETIKGVALVRLTGGLVPEIQVIADSGRLSAQALDVSSISARIERANINFPGGRVQHERTELPVRTVGRFKTLEDIEALSVGRGQTGGIVTIKDVAKVQWGYEEQTSISRVNGQPAVLLGIIKEPSANTIEVSRQVLAHLDEMRRKFENKVTLDVVNNEAPIIEKALRDLRSDALIGTFLAFMVLWIGLRKFSNAVLVGLSIPVSVLATFALMSIGGVSVNIMSIGGLALGIGMLVDCSIVVLECSHRKRMEYSDPIDAVAVAIREVGWSLVSGTLTTVAVLIPISSLSGIAQKLFRDFAFTLAASLLISLLTALFFLPAVMVWTQSSRRYSIAPKRRRLIVQSGYRSALVFFSRHPIVLLVMCGAFFAGGATLASRLGLELLPDMATGQFTIGVTMPVDSSLERLDQTCNKIEAWLKEAPDVQGFVTEGGSAPEKTGLSQATEVGKANEGTILVTLRRGSASYANPQIVVQELRRRCAELPDAQVAFAFNQGPLARVLGSGKKPELLRVVGDDLDSLVAVGQELMGRLRDATFLKDLDCDGIVWRKQLRVIVDRYRVSSQDISVEEVAEGVHNALEGKLSGKFLQGDKEIGIRVQLSTKGVGSVEELGRLPLVTTRDRESTVLVDQVASVKADQGPREVYRSDRRRNLVIHANVVGMPFSKGEDLAMKEASSADLPEGFEVRPGAEGVELKASMESLLVALGLAAMLVYVIMVIQFESLVWPLVVATCVPMTLVGPALALTLTRGSINVQVFVGVVVLVGIVVNNAILIVATINDFRYQGRALLDAVVEGSAVRLSPVLMTSLATIFGALPLCMSFGDAAPINKPLALTVSSGLLSSTFFTLFVVPTAYYVVARLGAGRIVGTDKREA